MPILGIDSATPVAGVAIIDEDKILAENFLNTGYTHSEKFLPMIKLTLEQANLTLKDLDGIALTKGPGSFTGLRIGMVTAKSLAQVTGLKLLGVSTLDALAYNLWGYNGIICPILNARKNEVYTALYEMQNNELKRISDYYALAPEKLVNMLLRQEKEVFFLGDGVKVYQDILTKGLSSLCKFAPFHNMLTRASSVACLGLKGLKEGKEDDYFSLEPVYLRKSEAEINWEAKHAK